MTRQIITSYVNPDLDGVASSIVMSVYLKYTRGIEVTPVFCGRLDAETQYILNLFQIPYPESFSSWTADSIYLVDTHDLKQLKEQIPQHKVVEIWDHHPSGRMEDFPNARLINEEIGAVATLIAEYIKNAAMPLENGLAALLYAAILSNTLNFSAPTTTLRDKDMAHWLLTHTDVPENLAEDMIAARSQFSEVSLRDLVMNNYKEFDLSGVRAGISQIEGAAVSEILQRSELESELATIATETGVPIVFLSLVDVNEKKTFLVAEHDKTREVLTQALGAKFTGHVASFDRILLRKSDLIPALKDYCVNRGKN